MRPPTATMNTPILDETVKLNVNETNESKYSRVVVTKEQAEKSITELTIIPEDFDIIQPRADQVWNCDEIGIDPNGNWTRIVCTYIWCTLGQIWKTQDGEHAPFWVTVLFYTRGDG